MRHHASNVARLASRCAALVERPVAAIRLSDSRYMVPWQVGTNLWALIDMTALDDHAQDCVSFRLRLQCQHLDLVRQLCRREQKAISATQRHHLTAPRLSS